MTILSEIIPSLPTLIDEMETTPRTLSICAQSLPITRTFCGTTYILPTIIRGTVIMV